MEQSLARYWCHMCQSEYSQRRPLLACVSCRSELIEEIDESEPHPGQFQMASQNSGFHLPQQAMQNIGNIASSFFGGMGAMPGNPQFQGNFQFNLGNLFGTNNRNRGASSQALRRLSTVKGSDVAGECSICFMEYEPEDLLHRMPCLHLFHQSCLDSWLRVNAICPICRVHL